MHDHDERALMIHYSLRCSLSSVWSPLSSIHSSLVRSTFVLSFQESTVESLTVVSESSLSSLTIVFAPRRHVVRRVLLHLLRPTGARSSCRSARCCHHATAAADATSAAAHASASDCTGTAVGSSTGGSSSSGRRSSAPIDAEARPADSLLGSHVRRESIRSWIGAAP
jgi:hypothetical protein